MKLLIASEGPINLGSLPFISEHKGTRQEEEVKEFFIISMAQKLFQSH